MGDAVTYPILNSTPLEDLHPQLHSAYVDVKAHFGAVGDGVSDDTAAIQAAIDGCGWPTEPAAVVLPAGDYVLNATGLVIDGGGASSTRELLFVGEKARLVTTAHSSAPMLDIKNSIESNTYISLRGLTFLTNASTTPYRTGVRVTKSESTSISDCVFTGSYGTGIDFVSGPYNRVSDCSFFNLSRGIIFSNTASYTNITNNHFGEALSGNGLNWIQAANGSGPTDHVIVDGNTFYSPGASLPIINLLNGVGWTITGNQFQESDQEAIWIGNNGSSEGHTIIGNVFRQGARHDVYIAGGQRNVVANNVFRERDAGVATNTFSAVRITNTFGGAAGHFNTVMGNTSSDTASALNYMVELDAGCDYCVVVGNIGAAGVLAGGANNQVGSNIAA